MRSRVYRRNLIAIVVASAFAVAIAVVAVILQGHTAWAATTMQCSGVHVYPGQDLDAVVNRDPLARATTFCVHAPSSGHAYSVDRAVVLGRGDRLLGQPGRVLTRGPATYGVPPAKVRGASGLEKVVELRGSNQLRWLDISGGQAGIGAWGAGPNSVMEYLAIHDTRRAGIKSMNGRLLRSNLYRNGMDPTLWGNTAAAVKGVHEYEAAHNWVHDNPANGLWCDHGCKDMGSGMPNGFWAHDNLIVGNGRWGVRYEYSPRVASDGRPTALIERNAIHANGYGGASMWDAQNATFRGNSFGAETIAGLGYAANAGRLAVLFFDSGRTDRTNLYNGDAVGNSLGGELIKGCEKPDSLVYCGGNGY